VGRLEHKLSLALVVVATVWFGLVAAWEMFGPLLAGHYASSASMGIIGDNMLRWGIAGPVWAYTAHAPPPSMYYCHHPWGIFWTTAALMKLLGHHDYLCRLAPVLLSTATPGLLFVLGRAIWRPAAGACAAAAFVVLPITLAFANFNALEVPVITWSLVGLWGFVRHCQTQKRRYLVASLLGLTMAMHADWPAYVLVAVMLGFGLPFGIIWPRPFGRVRPRPFARWWALTASLAVGSAAIYLVLFHQAGKLPDLLRSYGQRSRGAEAPLAAVLASRRYWIELSFTPIAIVVGKIAAVLCALRFLLLRSRHELIALALLAMASFQYLVFRQGADVHIYWPHYFAVFFALGVGALCATILGLAATWQPRRPTAALGLTMAAILLVLLAIVRDAVPALVYARGTGGRFNEKGLLIHSDGAKTAFLRWLEPQLATNTSVRMHIGMKTTWAQVWSLNRRIVKANRPLPKANKGPGKKKAAKQRASVYLADTRFLLDPLQAKLAQEHQVVAVGPFWLVRSDTDKGPIDAYAIVEREPNLLQWYLLSGTEPQRSVVADPYLTWELRTHYGQASAAVVPAMPPASFEQRRIAHNIAVARGNSAQAAELLAQIRRELKPPAARFDDGTELLGKRYAAGARPMLTLLFRAAARSTHDVQPVVRSRVISAASWSTTMADRRVREVALPMGLAPIRWRRGFVYADEIPIRKRPGTEIFALGFRNRKGSKRSKNKPPRLSSGKPVIEVLRLD